MKGSTARLLAWTAVAAQPLFIAAWVIAGALDGRYSHLEQGVSQLGAASAEAPLIVNLALGLLGLSFVAVGLSLRAALPRSRARAAAVALFAAAGLPGAERSLLARLRAVGRRGVPSPSLVVAALRPRLGRLRG